MVVDDQINLALNRIADNQEEMNDILKSILGHYNNVVPVMKRNADKAEQITEEAERGFGQQVKDLFRPQEH
jgi:hypothetical protein